MKATGVVLLSLFISTTVLAQPREEFFDISFKPARSGAYYFVVTEKKDSLWNRKAYYISRRTLAMEGWYRDEACAIPHGEVSWYHTSGFQKSTGRYVDGKKEGTWLQFSDKGMLVDSATYVAGRLKGVRLGWYDDGMIRDSMHFDGRGNGVEVGWYTDGQPQMSGRWIQDTLRHGRWQYLHPNGTVRARLDYAEGKLTACTVYDEEGRQLDASACEEKAPAPAGGLRGWRSFLEKNLDPQVPVRKGAPRGQYMVVVRFLVGREGEITDITPITSFGYGMEEEAVRIMKRSPRWTPGELWGRKVRSYHTQPITFVVQ